VTPELDEPLLLYIVATTEVVSMLLVIEWSEPKQPQALKGAPATGFGSQDPDPTEGPHDQEASESHLLEPTLSPEPQIGSRRCLRVPWNKEPLCHKSRSSLRVPTASTPTGPSSQRCPRVLGARSPRLPSKWRSIHRTP
jgi:hypothetical protein